MAGIGIALGGGGAKGLAHVLMLEALDELGVRPACVAGTSIGAVIGVLYCGGIPGKTLREMIERIEGLEDASAPPLGLPLFEWLDFIAPQFQGRGLIRAQGLISSLFESISAVRFDQLAIPLRVVTADFWTREEVVWDAGALRPAVEASMALPGLLAPVAHGGRVLVDGGAVNPVPFDVLPPECALTIAVDVLGTRTYGEGQVPTLSEAIFNTYQIMEKSIIQSKLRLRRPDIYIDVDVRDVRVLEFFKSREVFRQAQPAKDQLKRELEAKLSAAHA